MGLNEDFQKAAATASVAVLTAAPAIATEGTGEVRPHAHCMDAERSRRRLQGLVWA